MLSTTEDRKGLRDIKDTGTKVPCNPSKVDFDGTVSLTIMQNKPVSGLNTNVVSMIQWN